MTESPPLQADGIALEIAGRELVSRVDLVVERGRCVGLAGESGSGKTLSCRAFTGLLTRLGGTISRGRLALFGEDMTQAPESQWQRRRGRDVALVPQASMAALNPVRRVGRQLDETVRVHGARKSARRETLSLLERVRLADPEAAARSYPHELSGGERQRVMIALALAGRPQLLVADEPTTSLDVSVQRRILDLFGELRSEMGLAIVLVSHDLEVLQSVADEVVVMYGGCTVEAGPTDDVLRRPSHPYTRALLAAEPATAPDGTPLAEIPGRPVEPGSWEWGCRFAPRCAHAVDKCFAVDPAVRTTESGTRAACLRLDELAVRG